MARSEPRCLAFTEPGLCLNTGIFLSTHTEQTAMCEEKFTGFDKKTFGLVDHGPHLLVA